MATRNFTDRELECSCGCGKLPPQSSQDRLQAVRDEWGKPMRVNSAKRCPDHPIEAAKAGGPGAHAGKREDAPDEDPDYGGFDIAVYGDDSFDLLVVAKKHGFTGKGAKQKGDVDTRFVHMDDSPNLPYRPRPWFWTY